MIARGRANWSFLGLLLVACGSTPRPVPPAAAPAPELSEMPRLEAAREARTGRLVALLEHPVPAVRERATRALARIGDDPALAALIEATASSDAAVQAMAVWGLGIAGGGERAGASEAALLRLLERPGSDALRSAVLQALGRIGGERSLPALAAALTEPSPEVRAAAGIAAGMLGRRAIAIDDPTRDALAVGAGSAAAGDDGVRYAASFGLGREHQPPSKGPSAERAHRALVRLATDGDPETRAQAIAGLARREPAASRPMIEALSDRDWRVRLQAVLALTAERMGLEERAAVADALFEWWQLALGQDAAATTAHLLVEGLRALRPYAAEASVHAAATRLMDDAARKLAVDQLDDARHLIASMVHCRAIALLVGDGADGEGLEQLRDCGGKLRRGWPRHMRHRLLAEVIATGAHFDAAVRRDWLDRLASDGDPRVRAGVLDHAVALARTAPEWDAAVSVWLTAGIRDPEIEVAGTAADAIAAALSDPDLAARGYTVLADALVERARGGAGDVELTLTFLGAIRDGKVSAGIGACRAARSDGNRTVRELARTCVTALDGTDPGPTVPPSATPTPDVDPAALLGKRVVWVLETTRGPIEIELEPERAPWHVAVLHKLTTAGFYDGLMWHRVAAGFVVQGGAPGDSAWGGPGFVIPGEPSPGRYDRGTVGIADAGMDTGGSQIFMMHARAPHLEGRYTIVGQVVRGLEAMDALLVGDRIVKASMRVD